jgi:hypothetical protein
MQCWGSVYLFEKEIPREILRTNGFKVAEPSAGLVRGLYTLEEDGDILYFGMLFIVMDMDKIKGIENRIGYSFTDRDKLARAFTTKSFAKEETDHGRTCESQEGYRTRGDAILKQVLIEILTKNGYKTPQQITDAKSNWKIK